MQQLKPSAIYDEQSKTSKWDYLRDYANRRKLLEILSHCFDAVKLIGTYSSY